MRKTNDYRNLSMNREEISQSYREYEERVAREISKKKRMKKKIYCSIILFNTIVIAALCFNSFFNQYRSQQNADGNADDISAVNESDKDSDAQTGTSSVSYNVESVVISIDGRDYIDVDMSFLFDGCVIAFDESTGYPYKDRDGNLQVPLKPITNTLGASFSFDESGIATVEKDGVIVSITDGQDYIMRNDQKIYCMGDIPIQTVLMAFGVMTSWDKTDNVVSIDSQCSAGYAAETETGSINSNYWPPYNSAVNYQAAGDYSNAIQKYEEAMSGFVMQEDDRNCALIFDKLGSCQAHMGNYDKAVSCWHREELYWRSAGNHTQEIISANRKANYISSGLTIYAQVDVNSEFSLVKYYEETLEPKNGILLGAYSEMDRGISLFTNFPQLTGKEFAAYLVYFTYGLSPEKLDTYIEHLKKSRTAMELAIQPLNGLDEVNGNDGYLVSLAEYLENCGVDVYLRFANEMNDLTSSWYTSDGSYYIEKYRIVADVFRKHAPSVALLWAPNYYPPDTISEYYPGDDYVDFVGLSSYQSYSPELDPLGQGIDRSRYSCILDKVYSLYGARKPIIISEGAASYVTETNDYIYDFALYQLRDLYTYLPIKYPNVKAAFYFSHNTKNASYMLSGNETILNAYKELIQNPHYLSSVSQGDSLYDTYMPIAGACIPYDVKEICSYVKHADNQSVAKVDYYINDVLLGSSESIPYTINCDLKSYINQEIIIKAVACDKSGKEVTSRRVKAKVLE